MKNTIGFTGSILLLAVSNLSAATLYVSLGSTNPTPPYATWATAATNIQDAVDTAEVGDMVLVMDGRYAVGQRETFSIYTNSLGTNRVAITNAIALRSVNGPQFTVIDGGGTNRCVFLTDGASLSGFTLTNGWAAIGGGGVSCTSQAAFLTNCVITDNTAGVGTYQPGYGGGVAGCTLYNCTLTGNRAWRGGGANFCMLYNCVLTGNSANEDYSAGGGASECTLDNCVLTGNSAYYGGGVYEATLYNCTVTGNISNLGGGTEESTLYNCIVYFNTAASGANYDASTMNYCCTTPLPPDGVGNIALDPQLASATHLSASSPCRGAGSAAYATGTDIDGEVWGNPTSIGCDEYHAGAVTGPLTVGLMANYTNVTVGYPVALTALVEGRTTDSVWEFGDGDVVVNQPYITHTWTEPGDFLVTLGAFNESHVGGVSATVSIHVAAQLVHYVALTSTNPQPPYATWATAATNIQDAVDVTAVGGTVLVSNGVYATGVRTVSGTMTSRVALDKPLTLLSVNGPQFTIIDGGGVVRSASLTDGASLSGFTLTNGVADRGAGVWCTSAKAIVTNCVLVGNSAFEGGGAYGGTLDNCTLSGNWVADCGHGGGSGGGARRCTLNNCTLIANSACLGGGASEATLNSCTLTANSAGYGGGASSCTLNNCIVTANSAGGGGGASYCALNNCLVTSNSASIYGGGAEQSTFNNCTLTGNSAPSGGGTAHNPYGGAPSGPILNNCIVYDNTATNDANFDSFSYLVHCCTTPQPTNGVHNITNAPIFVDHVGGDLRLQTNSPCINAGNNAYVSGTTDFDGNPRIVSGTVDIGAYEFRGSGSMISYSWLQQYHLPTDGSADSSDTDQDGLNNWQEWTSGTDPTNPLSALSMLSAAPAGPNVTVSWQSVAGMTYFLERSANLAAPFTLLAPYIFGQAGTTTYTDFVGTDAGPFFYRVRVKAP